MIRRCGVTTQVTKRKLFCFKKKNRFDVNHSCEVVAGICFFLPFWLSLSYTLMWTTPVVLFRRTIRFFPSLLLMVPSWARTSSAHHNFPPREKNNASEQLKNTEFSILNANLTSNIYVNFSLFFSSSRFQFKIQMKEMKCHQFIITDISE